MTQVSELHEYSQDTCMSLEHIVQKCRAASRTCNTDGDWKIALFCKIFNGLNLFSQSSSYWIFFKQCEYLVKTKEN